MKYRYLALTVLSVIFSASAFAVREECLPQSPNSYMDGQRLNIGSAALALSPLQPFFHPARTSVAELPYDGINCEKTAVFAGNINGVAFPPVGYYQYGSFGVTPERKGVTIELSIEATSSIINNDHPIKFAEIYFHGEQSVSLYMKASDVVNGKKRERILSIYAEYEYQQWSGIGGFNIVTFPFPSAGIFRDVDVELRWQGREMRITGFNYTAWSDFNWYDYTRTKISTKEIALIAPIETVAVKIGSIANTRAFNDAASLKSVFAIDSVRWIIDTL
jgi:hypothetical protein